MSLKKITIVFLPDGINAVRQFKVPKVLMKLILVLSLTVVTVLVWASNDYLQLKKNIPEKTLRDLQPIIGKYINASKRPTGDR